MEMTDTEHIPMRDGIMDRLVVVPMVRPVL
jgi:hypothetical protein